MFLDELNFLSSLNKNITFWYSALFSVLIWEITFSFLFSVSLMLMILQYVSSLQQEKIYKSVRRFLFISRHRCRSKDTLSKCRPPTY